MDTYQLPLQLDTAHNHEEHDPRQGLQSLLSEDLDFHDQMSGYASHNFHSFPAKFPPQLPRKFIQGLTQPGDTVLDPMVGSGTTIVEAHLTGRRGMGFDIDPLAIMISKVKCTSIDPLVAARTGSSVLTDARLAVQERQDQLEAVLASRWDAESRRFVGYWFTREAQLELLALLLQVEQIPDPDLRTFYLLVFSSIIITKTGGVSLALDLAHTRPHRARVVKDQGGKVREGKDLADNPSPRTKFLTKTLRSPLEEFGKRYKRNVDRLLAIAHGSIRPDISFGNAQDLPLRDNAVDLIVTSPPYASNAIDYMRAHKFSLVWLGYPITDLGQRRREYIGGEALTAFQFEDLPSTAATVVNELGSVDRKKGRVLHRYYSEMARTLGEMHRVLKPGHAAIVVVGNSIMRGIDTRTEACLADIGQAIGFHVPGIGVRNLDRNRRMMPAGMRVDLDSQIQQRMHQEFVIGFQKPD